MQLLKWILIAIALLQGGWLVFDGGRALMVGDYVTPSSGRRAGQLGPWSKVVSALGFEPRSTIIKCLHLLLGLSWLIALVLFAVRPTVGWWTILSCAIASLWYLPLGTLLSVVAIVILMSPSVRQICS